MINIWIIGRNGTIKDINESAKGVIATDRITPEKSEFELVHERHSYDKGDFALCKYSGSNEIAYFGVVDSYENNTLKCSDLITLLNYDFVATKFSGSSFEAHAKTLITNTLFNDKNKQMTIIDIDIASNTKHIYQPAEPPTATNLMKYMINAFKKYNVVWEFVGFKNGRIKTRLIAHKTKINIKNNVDEFLNWDISTTEVGQGVDNHILIVDKATTNGEKPIILAQYWTNSKNEIVSNADDETIVRPTSTMVWIYDTAEENKPTYLEIATSELPMSYYSHEISFTMPFKNSLLSGYDLYTGVLANIIYDGKLYQSVLSSTEKEIDSDRMRLTFGHIRSRLTELLE